MKRFRFIVFCFIIISILLPISSLNASQAKDQLKTSIDHILEVLRDPALQGEENREHRRSLIREGIHERFSFARMSQLCLARHWKKRTDDEKKTFIELFGRLLENTYVTKIESYTDEKVVYVKDLVRKKKAQVNTKIVTDTVEIPINYRLDLTKDGSWRVYDIVIEGVSLVGNYRSQFNKVLQKHSYEKLVEDYLKKKIE